MTLVEYAKLLRPLIEKAVQSLTDNDALSGVALFPHWAVGVDYSVGEKVQYNGVLYSVLLAHTSQENWTPTEAHSLFAKVLITDPSVIPEWEQPDSTNPYVKGDKVRYKGVVYVSVIDNNVWSPEDYPAGWQIVDEE